MRLDSDRLQRELRRQGLSEAALATTCEVDAATVSRIVRGQADGTEAIERFAAALGIEPFDIAVDD